MKERVFKCEVVMTCEQRDVALTFLTLEWQNRGLNLFTIEEGTISVTAGTETYTLPSDTIDILEHQIRTGTGTNQIDTALERISVATYAQQTNKQTEGRPTQIFVQRLSTENESNVMACA